MSNTEPPPPTTTTPPVATVPAATAIDAGQARDGVENAAQAVFVAALLWYALHGEEEPGNTSLIAMSAHRLAVALWWARPRLSGSKPPPMTELERDEWIEEQTSQIVKLAQDDAAAHYDTVFKRMRRDDPHVKDTAIRSAYRLDTPWAKAASRSAATRLTAETAIDMKTEVESFTGEPHHLMWISRGDPKVRKLHRRLHGKVRPPGTPFHTWPDGATLNYPGDPTAPIDSWINCRCALMLVPAKDAKQAEAVFEVPDGDFDVPVAASAGWTSEARQADADLRSEKARRYTTKV
jgi:hypothetical protein